MGRLHVVTEAFFAGWVAALGRAWVEKNPQAAGALFAEDVTYHEDRFAEPMRGRAAVIAYWEDVLRTQQDIEFGSRVIGIVGDTGIAHWWASFKRIPTGLRVKLDGIMVAEFALDGCCRIFEEWWQIEEPAQS